MEDTTEQNNVADHSQMENDSQKNYCPFSMDDELQDEVNSDMRKFHVLDEVQNDSDSQESDSDSDIPDDEVERMLDEAYIGRKRSADDAGLGKAFPGYDWIASFFMCI